MYRYLVKILLTSMLLVGASAAAHAVTLKIATQAPDGSSWMNEMRAGAEEISKRTEGRVKFKFYPGGVMGNYKSVLKKIRLGQLQGGAVTGDSMLSVYPEMRSYSLPMMLRNYAEVDTVRPKIDPLLKKGMRENGFELLGITEGGLVYLMSNDRILTTDGLKSHKVWIPEDDVLNESLFNKMGVSPISLPLSDVYTGLQTGLIDTIGATPTGALAFQWHTRIQAVTDVPLLYVVGILVISNQAFGKISDSDQAIVREVMNKVFASMDRINREDNEKARAALQNNGIEFVRPEADEIEHWKQLANEVISEHGGDTLKSPVYLEMIRLLTDYRNTSR